MPNNKYSYQGPQEKTAKAIAPRQNVSFKQANQVCNAINGMNVDKAMTYLEKVQTLEAVIPFTKYTRGIGHRVHGVIGRYPQKASAMVHGLLKNAKANADFKGLATEKLKVAHATAYRKQRFDRRRPKGGGSSPDRHHIDWAGIELVVKEV